MTMTTMTTMRMRDMLPPDKLLGMEVDTFTIVFAFVATVLLIVVPFFPLYTL